MKYENIKGYKDVQFRQVTGVLPKTFGDMCEVLKAAYAEVRKRRGRKRDLSIEDMLLLTLEYYKEYRAYECIGASYGVSKSTVCKIIKWVEESLIKSGLFSLPGKKVLRQSEVEIEVILVDTTETPIQRPSKGQKQYYSGKKNGTP